MFRSLGIGQIIVQHWYSMPLRCSSKSLQYCCSYRLLDGTMIGYLDKVHALLHDFNELLSLASTP